MANRNGYQDNNDGTQRYYPQGGVYDQTSSYDHELYPDVTNQQPSPNPSYQSGQTRASRVRHTQRQTTADLTQVDNSQVAGRVAYDEEGNLVVVKKEEKSSPVQMAAIVGSALSAVTSAFFSSHIGIGGSVLTVAIGAAVSAAATQLYTHLIKKSTDKLKSVAHNAGSGSQQLEGVMDSSQLDGGYGYGADYETYGTSAYGAYDADGYATTQGSRIAPQGMIDAADEAHERQVKRRGIIIVAIAALIAVIAAAGVVTLATNGNGIGAKTPSIVRTVTSTDTNENLNQNATDNTNANTTANAAQEDSEKENTTATENTNTTTETPSQTTTTDTGSDNPSTTTTNTTSGTGTSTNGSGTTSNRGSNTSTSTTTGGSTSGAGTTGTTTGGSTSGAGTSGTSTSGTTTGGSTDSGSTTSSGSGETLSTQSEAETQSSHSQNAEAQSAEGDATDAAAE